MRDRLRVSSLILFLPVLFLFLPVLWACGQSERPAETNGTKPPQMPAQAVVPPTPRVSEVVEPSAPSTAPVQQARASDPEGGRVHYETLCSSCHGLRGDGDGPVGQSLDPKPRKHSDGDYMNELSDEHLFLVIKEGGAAVGKSALMAPWGAALSDDQIRDVVAFVRTLAEPPFAGPES